MHDIDAHIYAGRVHSWEIAIFLVKEDASLLYCQTDEHGRTLHNA